jgi:hypothetical protein
MPHQIVRNIPASEQGRMPKGLNIFIRQQGKHFRVIYQRQYPRAVEEVVISPRFNTREEAQSFVDAGLRAQRIYRSLTSAAAPLRLA